ncbi:hypothetical protein Scep_015983 [Stephania cephalantha]|uniref:S-acyltransferase n=1 Tax=Stephania cephalantha TaxID=152367 RepID=A0AAP0IMB1_9MAGN
MDGAIEEECRAISILEEPGTTCWGCGFHILVPSFTTVFKCGWCGAITNQNPRRHGIGRPRWKYVRDRCLVVVLLIFMLLVICGGVWAVYPVVFSISFSRGVIHCTVTTILSVSTIASFSFAAFRSPGAPPIIPWGGYPLVGKGWLENYSFCVYCSKPKPPRTHHCRSCGMCVLDMDHHCPFIGNCVGAANHRSFIIFLASAVISTIYACIMSIYAGYRVWPPLASLSLHHVTRPGADSGLKVVKDVVVAFLNSAVLLSPRDVVLVYLFIASFSVEIGLSVLLWQQLRYIYKGKTYLSQLSSPEEDNIGDGGCRNLLRFFGCPYFASAFRTFFSRKKVMTSEVGNCKRRD